jgi:type I restriction enzyme, S subunit
MKMNKRPMKPSDLGDIPIDWEIKKLGEILKIKHGKNQSAVVSEDGEYPIFGSGGQIGKSVKFLYDKPSVMIGRKGTIDVPRYTETPFWTIDTLFYTEISIFAIPKFIYYKFQIIDWYSHNEASGVPSLRGSTIEGLKIPLPPLLEQKKIASILSSLDTLIQSSSQVLKQLETVKHGTIQKLLTQGVKAWHSKFEKTKWGIFPLGWQIIKISELSKNQVIRTGPFGSSLKSIDFSSSGVPVITIGSLGSGDILTENLMYISDRKANELKEYRVQEGDLVFSRVADVGRSIVVSSDMNDYIISSNLMRIRIDKSQYNPYFIMYSITCGSVVKNQLTQIVPDAGRQVVNSSTLGKLFVVIPPLLEQERIVSILSSFDQRIRLEQNYKIALETLKKGLMQQLLCGKLDVRDVTVLEEKVT